MEREPMWYDERYYLEDENEYDREPLYNLQRHVILGKELSEITYSSLINRYDLFIKKVSCLIGNISLKDNSLSAALSTGILLNHGMFSIGGKLIYNDSSFDTLSFKLGLDIVRGKARCRHYSSFIDDVMKNLGIKSNKFSCVCIDKYNEISLVSTPVNHMANVVYFGGVPYVYDALNNNTFFEFVDEFTVISTDFISSIYYYYKPYFEMFYDCKSLSDIKEQLESYSKSVGRGISKQEFLELERETNEKLEKDMDLIYDFILDTDEDLKIMEKEIQKIKRKNNN